MEMHQPTKTDYSKGASGHAKLAVAVWIGYGIYALFTQKVHGGIISFLLIYTLYTTIGLVVASLASMLTYLPMYYLDFLHDKTKNRKIGIALGLATLILSPVALVLTILWTIFVAIWFIGVCNNFFSF